jgi:Fe2+ transport system protein B
MDNISQAISDTFGPILRPIFSPMDGPISALPAIVWTLSAAGLFIAAMAWVFTLKKEYVNIDAPGKGPLYDLRFWTVVSMTPHVIVYLYFGITSL